MITLPTVPTVSRTPFLTAPDGVDSFVQDRPQPPVHADSNGSPRRRHLCRRGDPRSPAGHENAALCRGVGGRRFPVTETVSPLLRRNGGWPSGVDDCVGRSSRSPSRWGPTVCDGVVVTTWPATVLHPCRMNPTIFPASVSAPHTASWIHTRRHRSVHRLPDTRFTTPILRCPDIHAALFLLKTGSTSI